MSFEERCYVVYGNGFQALKIKGLSQKKKLMTKLKEKKFSPKSIQLNCQSSSGKKCTRSPTKY